MKLNEENELKNITAEYTKAIGHFKSRSYQKAIDIFDKIIEKYKDSEYYSVLEIQARSQTFKNICQSSINPVKIELKGNEDYLYEGIYQLNAGNLDQARKMFESLLKNKYTDPYLDYLFALLYLKTGDKAASIKYLKNSIEKDNVYKIVAANEVDFEPLNEDEAYLALIE